MFGKLNANISAITPMCVIIFGQMRAKSQIETEISKIVDLASDSEKIISLQDWLSTHPLDETEYAFGFVRRKFRSTLAELWDRWCFGTEQAPTAEPRPGSRSGAPG
jgi:hypothetical protein